MLKEFTQSMTILDVWRETNLRFGLDAHYMDEPATAPEQNAHAFKNNDLQ